MKTTLWIPALIAAATFSASAFAQDGDRHEGRDDNRYHQQASHRHTQTPPPPPAYRRNDYRNEYRNNYRDERDYRYEPTRYNRPVTKVYLPLPPSPFEVHRAIIDALFNP